MPKNNLLLRAEALEKADDNNKKLLIFGSSEQIFTAEISGELLEFKSPKSIYKILKKLEDKGILKVRAVNYGLNKSKINVYYLSAHGLALAAELTGQTRSYVGRISENMIAHTIDAQKAKIRLMKRGYTDWMSESMISSKITSSIGHQPDATMRHPSGRLLAFEMERHVKSQKRYQSILAGYHMAIKHGLLDGVLYVCPDEFLVKVLERTFLKLSCKTYVRSGIQVVITRKFLEQRIKITHLKALEEMK